MTSWTSFCCWPCRILANFRSRAISSIVVDCRSEEGECKGRELEGTGQDVLHIVKWEFLTLQSLSSKAIHGERGRSRERWAFITGRCLIWTHSWSRATFKYWEFRSFNRNTRYETLRSFRYGVPCFVSRMVLGSQEGCSWWVFHDLSLNMDTHWRPPVYLPRVGKSCFVHLSLIFIVAPVSRPNVFVLEGAASVNSYLGMFPFLRLALIFY